MVRMTYTYWILFLLFPLNNKKDFILALAQSVLELKGEMLMLNVMRLQDINIESIEAALQLKRDEAPMFFIQSPVVVDCSSLGDRGAMLDLRALRRVLIKMGFVPVGLRGISDEMRAASLAAGWNVLRSPAKRSDQQETAEKAPKKVAEAVVEKPKKQEAVEKKPLVKEKTSEPVESTEPQHEMPPVSGIAKTSLTIDRPIRSGQQVYAKDAELVVLTHTSAGSEVMSDGSIHVYGALRGRVLAGVKGDKTARIFCRSLEAELIVIAGCYQLLDESDTKLKGKPAMIHLENDKLIIEPLD